MPDPTPLHVGSLSIEAKPTAAYLRYGRDTEGVVPCIVLSIPGGKDIRVSSADPSFWASVSAVAHHAADVAARREENARVAAEYAAETGKRPTPRELGQRVVKETR